MPIAYGSEHLRLFFTFGASRKRAICNSLIRNGKGGTRTLDPGVTFDFNDLDKKSTTEQTGSRKISASLVVYNVEQTQQSVTHAMKTIQMTIDARLLKVVDKMRKARKTTRSAFIRDALEAEIRRQRIHENEMRHAEGYTRAPVRPGEFDVWLNEQDWGAS